MKNAASLRILYLFNFLKSLQFFGALAVPFYLHRAGLDYFRMFVLEAIFSACMIVLEIPTGVVADRTGRKVSLFWGALAFGAGFLVFGLTVSYPLLIAAEVVCALGMCLLSGADRALVYELAVEGASAGGGRVEAESGIDGKDRGEGSGRVDRAAAVAARFDAFGTAGMLVAFPVGTLFAGSGLVPYRTALGLVFVATAAAVALSALVLLLVREPARDPFQGSALRSGLDGFLSIFKDVALSRFGLNYAAVSSLSFFMFWFYQTLLMKNGFPIAFQGFIAAGFNGAAMVLLLFEGPIGKKVGLKNALFLSSLVPGLLYLGVAAVPGLPMALAAIFGVTMLRMFRAPLLTALMNERIEDSRRATVLSGVSMLERVATTVLYPVAGFLTDLSPGSTFLLMGASMVLISFFLRVEEEHLGSAA
jgi:MFS family permease